MSSTAAGRETRERLILTAERIFAQRGVGVALREIGDEAGQRNSAVVHYYFGDRAGLIRAIFEYRVDEVQSRRAELLAQVFRSTHPKTRERLRGLIEAIVTPLVEQSSKGHFLGFVARMQLDFGRTRDFAPDAFLEDALALREHFHHELAVCEPVADSRFISMVLLTVHSLAMWQISGDAPRGLSYEVFVADLIDSLEGLLCGPQGDTEIAEATG